MLLVSLSSLTAESVLGQRRVRSCERELSERPQASIARLVSELEREAVGGRSFLMRFRRTNLDTEAEAMAQVVINQQTLIVRVCAVDLPLPVRFGVQQYSLWVYLTNYQQKIHLGDLPIVPANRVERRRTERTGRGNADSVFRYPSLPRGAVFGGLIITAEPTRYTPIINEPLRPLLVAYVSEGAG